MTTFIARDDLMAVLTATHERVITPALFGGKAVLIREITARQRLMANEAALAENPENPDQALYQAMLIQMSVVDPESGTPGDPRTRTPLLSPADVESLAEGREHAVRELFEAIAALAGLGPRWLFRGHSAADGPQRDAGGGAESAPDAALSAPRGGTGDDDGGSSVSLEPAGGHAELGALE